MNSKLLYRPDIDGLRAIAVLSVFAFHLGMYRYARGGFVGVDIFFVISGFLITKIIAEQILSSSFSFAGFYRRRALRILPAFIVMILGTAAASLILLPPVEVVEFGKSAAAASLSVANIFFYFSPSGYFFDDLNARPLLHTWSLGVEEQFYLLFPLLLVFAHRISRIRAAVLILGLTSFIASLLSLRSDPNGAFFLLPSRFWELMLGGAGALKLIPFPTRRIFREVTALTGLVMLVWAIKTTDATYLPIYWAIVPCVGAILLILSGDAGETSIGKLLSLKPVVWVGLISYSLYLWHWPVIVMSRFGLGLPFTLENRLAIITISFFLAGFSWWAIERPFRTLPKSLPSSRILIPAASAMILTTVAGLVLIYSNGFPGRFDTHAVKISNYLNPRAGNSFRSGVCFVSTPYEHFDWEQCLGQETGHKRVIIFGDSHAADLWSGLSGNLRGYDIRQVTTTYCRPLLGMYQAGLPFCSAIVDRFFREYFAAFHPNDIILISERWKGDQFPAIKGTIRAFLATGAKVVLVGPVPEYSEALPRLEFASIIWKKPDLVRHSEDITLRKIDVDLTELAEEEHVRYVSLIKILCATSECRFNVRPDVPLLTDTDHLSGEGSSFIAPYLISKINEGPSG